MSSTSEELASQAEQLQSAISYFRIDDDFSYDTEFGVYNAGSSSYDQSMSALAQVFDAVVWLPEVHDANIVVICFKKAPGLYI